MPDATIDLIRTLAENMMVLKDGVRQHHTDWSSFTFRLEFDDEFNGNSGYAYQGDTITAVSCRTLLIEDAVADYIASVYKPGATLPVLILVQFDAETGQYEITPEDTDTSRWDVTPDNYAIVREELRPRFN